ncbi:PAS domain S-box protein [Methanoculleus sp.]|uniref:PAS domain S-box protein n=1 Tax=Methanoculleus sp. TaxID=90427 RepID=UPI001BD2BD39|nr:PAS domain S-box protein [Methanoculleus sp.]
MTSVQQIEEQCLLIALDGEADGILVFDEDRTVVWLNRTLSVLLDVTPEEERGASVSDFIRRLMAPLSPDTASLQEIAVDLQNDRSIHRLPIRVRERTGDLRWFSLVYDRHATCAGTGYRILRFHDSTGETTARFFRACLDHSPVVVFVQDRDLRYIWSYNRESGLSDTEVVGRTDADLFGPEDAGRLVSLKRRVLETGEVLRQEVTITPGGTRHVLDMTLEPLRDADGRIVGISGTAVDASGRVRAEEECRPGTDTLNLILRNARDIVYRIELAPVRRFSYISPAVTRIAGYTPEEVYADPDIALRFIYPDDLPLLEAVFRGEFAPDRPLILRWLRKDGTVIWVESQNVPIRDEEELLIAIEGIARDVTERKQIEEALRESEERFRRIFEEAGIGILIADPNGVIIRSNATLHRMLGYGAEELAGRSIADITHPEDLPPTLALYELMAEGRERGVQLEKRYIRKDGRVIWGRITITFIRDPVGKPLRAISMVEDISKRKQIEEALQESEERFRSIFNESPIGIEYYDAAGNLIDVNPAALRIFGVLDRDDLVGFNLFLDPNIPEQELARLKSGETVHYTSEFDFELVKRQNLYATSRSGTRYLDTLITKIRQADEASPGGYVVLVQDITAQVKEDILRRQTYEQIQQNIEQFAILGDHVRQPLQVILGMVELSEGGKEMDIIHDQVDRINAIIRQLDLGWMESRKIRDFLQRHEPA